MKHRLMALVAIGFVTSPISAQAGYNYTQIDYPGTPATQVFGVNKFGRVVGNGETTTDFYPFVYDWKFNTLTDVAPADGFDITAVLGINDVGVMVGSVSDASSESGFIRKPDGTYTFFTHPDATFFTQARAINLNGLVTGFRDTATGSAGFIYNPATDSFTDFADSLSTIAQGIDSVGRVVGSAYLADNEACNGAPAGNYGFIRAVDGSITYFRINGRDTTARGINDAGAIVGSVAGANAGEIFGYVINRKSFRYPCEAITVKQGALLQFPGYLQTVPEGITKAGDIVGILWDGADFHGFSARPKK